MGSVKKTPTPPGNAAHHIKEAQRRLLHDRAIGKFKQFDTPEVHEAKRASGYFDEAARRKRHMLEPKKSFSRVGRNFDSSRRVPDALKNLPPSGKKVAKKRVNLKAGLKAAQSRDQLKAKSAVRSNSRFSKASKVAKRVGAKLGVGAKLAGRVFIPAAVAADVVGIVGAGVEGIRALKARAEAKRNEAYMKKHYGTIEAARATRHRKQKEQ